MAMVVFAFQYVCKHHKIQLLLKQMVYNTCDLKLRKLKSHQYRDETQRDEMMSLKGRM